MGETPKLQVCLACSVIHKKTRVCNRCQKVMNKVLSKGSEYLCKCILTLRKKSVIILLISKNLCLLCHYGVVCRLMRGKTNLFYNKAVT